MNNIDMTVVTYPDYHLEPGAHNIVVTGGHKDRQQIQDLIGELWPSKVAVYHLENPSIPNVNSKIAHAFTYMSLSHTQIILIEQTSSLLTNMLPICKNAFIIIVDDQALEYVTCSLNLTYPGRLFFNIEDAVKAAILATK